MDALTFLQGGGEMGALTRAYDWNNHPLGSPDTWPQSLLTTVSIILNSRFPMFLWWGSDHYQFYNDAYRPSMGAEGKHPTALGQKGADCWPEIWAIIHPLMQQVLDGGESTWQEDSLIPIYRNGQLEDVYWTFSYSAVRGDTGHVAGILVVCSETTRSVQSFQQLQHSEQRFRNLIRQATIGIAVLTGPEMHITIVNDAYGRLIGRTVEELQDQSLLEIIPDIPLIFQQQLERVRTTGEPSFLYQQHFEVMSKGRKIGGYVNVNYEPYRDADGTIIGVMALCQDVTSQVVNSSKLAEMKLANASYAQRLEIALEAAQLGSFEFDLHTGEVICNEQCRIHLGLPPANKYYQWEMAEILDQADRAEKAAAWQKAVMEKDIYSAEYQVKQPDGSIRYVITSGNTMCDEAGQPAKMVGVTIDITEQKLFTQRLSTLVSERTAELQRSNDDLLQFAHITSHDLKEPVRKVKVWSSRLQEDTTSHLSDNGRFYLQKVQSATDRIQLMIDGILAYSSASASEQAITEVDLNQVIRHIREDMEILIHDKHATIHTSPLPVIQGAAILLYQVFYNLVYNSLKFSKKDTPPVITIEAVEKTEQEKKWLSVTVTDNGIGFEPEYNTKIFIAFARLNSKDAYEGTGLGLALCQRVVRRHGGSITASGMPGKGAAFHLLLPVTQDNNKLQHL
ncbi:hypothetical protein SAMN05444266_10356 [Chitinophaga jiangningensis]|uniref:histidine kinase n=1 Tax=Chitinophaga jiangningensis TaxID=1419482 RepID=A0A1M6ZYJ5_9BACT|nr:PAS domain-containing protein [Chitinophaga jiangningensis]SHL35557.1 hypothetical protein SAMN05444266_10356 [Chitinophaga jiangningensis]